MLRAARKNFLRSCTILILCSLAFAQNPPYFDGYSVPTSGVGLTVFIGPGAATTPGGAIVSWQGGKITVSANATTYIYLDNTGTIQTSTTGYAGGSIPLAITTADFNHVLTVKDVRASYNFNAGGGNGIPFLIRTNSPNGTTLNQLVSYDTTNLDSNGIATVQTAPVSSKAVIGVCIAGCGTTGTATIGTYLAANCTSDNQTTVGDLVAASATNAGQCDDYGASISTTVQTVGRVSKANTGTGTNSLVDFFLGDLLAPGSQNGSGTVSNCSTIDALAYYAATGTSVSCDPLFTTDGAGNWRSKSGTTTDTAHAGYINYIQGPAPPAAPANGVQTAAQTSVTGYTLLWPNGPNTGCLFGTNSSGTVTLSYQNPCGGASSPTASNPVAPTLSTSGSAGSTSYTYAVVGCEDVNCTYHSALSGTTTIGTGNANLTTSNFINLSAYADTLYGYRFYKVCRTASAGTPSTTGVILSGAWKKVADTGLAGDGTNCATAYSANTTQLDTHCLASSLPTGINVMPGTPCGVDAPPTSPVAANDEFTYGDGTHQPGGVNYTDWTWGATSATSLLTNGELTITTGTTTTTNYLISATALPATPYTFIVQMNELIFSSNSSGSHCYLGLRESATGKMSDISLGNNQGSGTTAGSGGTYWAVLNWTNDSTFSAPFFQPYQPNQAYLQIQNDGTNLKYSFSNDGVSYKQFYSQTIVTPFTTAPNQLIIGGVGGAGVPVTCTYDYIRRTQ